MLPQVTTARCFIVQTYLLIPSKCAVGVVLGDVVGTVPLLLLAVLNVGVILGVAVGKNDQLIGVVLGSSLGVSVGACRYILVLLGK